MSFITNLYSFLSSDKLRGKLVWDFFDMLKFSCMRYAIYFQQNTNSMQFCDFWSVTNLGIEFVWKQCFILTSVVIQVLIAILVDVAPDALYSSTYCHTSGCCTWCLLTLAPTLEHTLPYLLFTSILLCDIFLSWFWIK